MGFPETTFQSITDESNVAYLVSLSAHRAVTERWVAGLLARGETRPEWCRMATSATGNLLAAQALDSWSLDASPGAVPTSVHLLGHADAAAAADLLAHDLRSFGAESVEARISLNTNAPVELRQLRESQPSVLEAAGFVLAVNRVRIEWLTATGVRAPAGALTFQPANSFSDDELVEVFAQVGDGSVDHGMVAGRAVNGRRAEAEQRLRHARRRTHEDGWFVVGLDRADEPIGYVQSAMDDETAILAELGVVEGQRGRHYSADLLAYGTAVLAGAGVARITSTTDTANHAMRAAFARCGYVEFAAQRDFRWTANPPERG